ncbi:M23 family metallopeptidase [candidate division CSSED10-310 bacterium]|uniref:M23 family metallopeptidase n=1 Tax=candidate division CSSED10-310 bacterium TaxID=2855610 RepID=A0ABV6YWI5_UNCC1
MNRAGYWFIMMIVFHFLSGFVSAAERDCSRDVVCLITEKRGNTIVFQGQNLQTYEVTVTLEFPQLLNITVDAKIPLTATLPGRKKVKLCRISPRIKGKRWRYRYKYHWVRGSIHAEHDDAYVYSLPYAPGTSFRIIQGFFGTFSHHDKHALDWNMPEGTPVLAARGGVVVAVESKFVVGKHDPDYKTRANYVILKHDDGTYADYYHLRKGGVIVRLGQTVKTGQCIGYSGNTGYSNGPHLHLQVYKAENGLKQITYPIRFDTAQGYDIELQEGEKYTAGESYE